MGTNAILEGLISFYIKITIMRISNNIHSKNPYIRIEKLRTLPCFAKTVYSRLMKLLTFSIII